MIIDGLTFKTEPWPHQLQGVKDIAAWKCWILGFDMGTGKSKTLIDHLVNSESYVNMVVCPKSVRPAWLKQIALHGDGIEGIVLDGSGKKKTEIAKDAIKYRTKHKLLLINNYESVWREPFRSFALRQAWDTVGADESHRIKAAGSKVSRFFGTLAPRCKYRVGLTGIVMPHSPADIYGQMRYVDRSPFGTSFGRFRRRYMVLGGFQGREVVGFQRQEEMNKKLFSDVLLSTREMFWI